MEYYIGLENKDGKINCFCAHFSQISAILKMNREELTNLIRLNIFDSLDDTQNRNEFQLCAKKDPDCTYYLFNKQDKWECHTTSEFK
jgi:hypothetical protein